MPEFDELAEINGVKPKIVLADGETRTVKSQSSGATTYTIKRTYDHFYCTCPGWRNNGGPVNARSCKHLKATLGEVYEWERIEAKNPGVQQPLPGRQAAADKKENKTKNKGKGKKRRSSDDDDEDDDEEEEEEIKERGKKVKKEAADDESTESSSSSSSSSGSDEDEEDVEMTFSDLDDMDTEQLAIEKDMMERRMERINALLRAAKSKGKKRASRKEARAARAAQATKEAKAAKAKEALKTKRTITGRIPRGKPADDDDDEEEEAEEEEEEDDGEAPQAPNSKMRPQLLLAEKWDLEKGIDPAGWWMSEKLDGVRAYWNGSTFLSREGNKFYAPDWFTKKFPKDITLDGELTCGRGKFIDTVSIVKTINAGDRWKFSVEYHVFDVPSIGNKKFEERQEYLKKMLAERRIKWVRYVEQTEVEDKDHVLDELEKITEQGGEGLMLREPGSVYVQKRSKTCLKVKTFHDAEAKVIGHEEGKGRNLGRCGALKCEMMDGSGKKFKVGTGLDDNMRKNPPKVGAVITYRYFELTKDGVPRFPSFLRVFKGH
ncbi:hypothetical protein TWF730_010645 [Orbilia blumenaviensis]|uniref:SWIM-type domain-containing protein n=1 Tax=Orbilia blumenaviensis TaxID=1796055 RepID=A0AAV9UQE3_9PEZI